MYILIIYLLYMYKAYANSQNSSRKVVKRRKVRYRGQ